MFFDNLCLIIQYFITFVVLKVKAIFRFQGVVVDLRMHVGCYEEVYIITGF
jgi:hypothetical protein